MGGYRADIPDFYPVIPDFYPDIPDLYPRHSRPLRPNIPDFYPVIPAKAGIQRVANRTGTPARAR